MIEDNKPDVDAVDELGAFQNLVNTLKPFDNDKKKKLLEMVFKFFELEITSNSVSNITSFGKNPLIEKSYDSEFSKDRSLSPKEFLFEKDPKTDVERVACLAYYLTHYLNTPHFKTIDISKLNTEAAQLKFSNPAFAVDNATKAGYLVPAIKNQKQLSANGEIFVQALPDRDAAKEAMKGFRVKRKSKSQQKKSDNKSN